MLNVMIVDDAMIMRNMLSKKLKDLGHNIVAEASNGAEAVILYKDHKPDLVTMDITMPKMDGIDSLKSIIKFDHDAKVIMITSHGEENRVIEAIRSGAKGYVLKPLDREKLQGSIAKAFPS